MFQAARNAEKSDFVSFRNSRVKLCRNRAAISWRPAHRRMNVVELQWMHLLNGRHVKVKAVITISSKLLHYYFMIQKFFVRSILYSLQKKKKKTKGLPTMYQPCIHCVSIKCPSIGLVFQAILHKIKTSQETEWSSFSQMKERLPLPMSKWTKKTWL